MLFRLVLVQPVESLTVTVKVPYSSFSTNHNIIGILECTSKNIREEANKTFNGKKQESLKVGKAVKGNAITQYILCQIDFMEVYDV